MGSCFIGQTKTNIIYISRRDNMGWVELEREPGTGWKALNRIAGTGWCQLGSSAIVPSPNIIQLREHNTGVSVTKGVAYSKEGASYIHAEDAAGAGSDDGHVFLVFAKSDFQANDEVNVTYRVNNPNDANAWYAVRDGSYNRTSMVDFPDGNPIISKGNGTVLSGSLIDDDGWHTLNLVITPANYSEDYITIDVWIYKKYSSYQYELDVDRVWVTRGAATIFDDHFTGALRMVTGTANDYGYIATE